MSRVIRSSIRMFYKAFKGEILVLPSRTIAFLFGVFLFLIPLRANSYTLFVLTFANIFVIFAVSWDLLSGYTGQVNFGHAAFFGVAAYTAALLNMHLGFSPWIKPGNILFCLHHGPKLTASRTRER